MCGRVMQTDGEVEWLPTEIGNPDDPHIATWQPNTNAAPSDYLWVIRRHPGTGQNVRDLLKWGFVPNQERDPAGGRKPINARCEGVGSLPTFRDAYRRRRCLVPVDLFFEWFKAFEPDGKQVKGPRQPFAIAMADRSKFTLAGIWSNWKEPGTGEFIRNFAIVTCPANTVIGRIHDRMPVIVPPEAAERWLANLEPDPHDLLAPYPAELMDIWPISASVNSPRNKDVHLADPI